MSFIWLAGHNPCFVTSELNLVPLEVIRDAPYLQVDGVHTTHRDRQDIAALCGVRVDKGRVQIDLANVRRSAAPAVDDEESLTGSESEAGVEGAGGAGRGPGQSRGGAPRGGAVVGRVRHQVGSGAGQNLGHHIRYCGT